MFEVIVKNTENTGKLNYYVSYVDIRACQKSSEDCYMVDINHPEKGYCIDNVNIIDLVAYSPDSPVMAIIDIFCKRDGKVYRSIPKENQVLLIFNNLEEYEQYYKKHTKVTKDMSQKNEFENYAKTFMNLLDVATDYLSNPEDMTAADFINNVMNIDKNKNTAKKECTYKQSEPKCNCEKKSENHESSCSFSLSVGNSGVHVYRTNDKCYINDTEVSREDYDNALNVLACTGCIETKINSIRDILEESKQSSVNNKRIAELEESIARAQRELESLKRK